MNNLRVSYQKLWSLLVSKQLKKKDLQAMTHLSSAVIAKLGKNELVHLDTLVKICSALECDIAEIIELK